MSVRILTGDAREVLATLEADRFHCCVCSPPYWGLRDYGVPGQLVLEESFDEYLEKLVAVFEEVRRVLRPDGTAWVNMGDAYAGSWGAQSRNGEGGTPLSDTQIQAHPKKTRTGSLDKVPGCKAKDLIGQPWALAFALRAAGWWLRSEIIWHKPNPMPESVTDRPTKAHEQIFLLAKSERYHYDATAIREPSSFEPGTERRAFTSPRALAMGRQPSGNEIDGWVTESGFRNKRTVWTVPSSPFAGAHFATFPPDLIKPCILAGCPEGGEVLDPFAGACTTLLVADRLGRNALGIELNPDYVRMGEKRIRDDCPMFTSVVVERPTSSAPIQGGAP